MVDQPEEDTVDLTDKEQETAEPSPADDSKEKDEAQEARKRAVHRKAAGISLLWIPTEEDLA